MGDGSPRSRAAKATATRIQLGCGAAALTPFLLAGVGFLVMVLGGVETKGKEVVLVVASAFVLFPLFGYVQIARYWNRAGEPDPRGGEGSDARWRKSHAPGDTLVLGNSPIGGIAVWVVFTLLWFGPVVAITFLAWDKISREAWTVGLIAVFWLAGLFLLTMTVIAILHAIKYPRASLVLDAVPARLGGWLSGVVRAPSSVHEGAVTLKVSAVKLVRGGRSGSQRWTLWTETKLLDGARCERRSDHVAVPFSIRLPANNPEPEGVMANLLQGSNDLVGPDVTWDVTVQADVPGVDYDDSFEVPVGDADPGAPAPPDEAPRAMPILAGEKLAGRLPGRVEHGHDADSFVFPNRPVWMAWVVVPALVAALCVVDVVLRVMSGGTPADARGLPFMGFMGFEAVAFTGLAMGGLAALTLLGLMFDTRRIDVTPSEVRVRRGVLGIGFHRTIPRGQVTAVEAKATGLQQPTYDVKLRLKGGGDQSVTTGMRTVDQAEALAARLRGILQLSST